MRDDEHDMRTEDTSDADGYASDERDLDAGVDDFPIPTTERPVVLAEKCERFGNPKGRCTSCMDACPHACLYIDEVASGEPDAESKAYVPVLDGRHCIGCYLCCAACPTGAVAPLANDVIALKSNMDRLATHYDRLYLTCSRSGASAYSGAITEVPCLGCLPWEFYFACLADFRDMAVFLPLGLCDGCPMGDGEEMMMEAIDRAEQMSKTSLGLVCEKEDLDFYVIGSGDETVGRRDFLTSVTDYLSDASRKSQSRDIGLGLGDREERARRVMEANRAARKEREERFAEAHETGFLRTKARAMAPRRKVLYDALAAHPELAETTSITSVRNTDACTMCRTCLRICPVSARRVRNMRLSTDDTFCTGCGKCVEMCPEDAIHLVEAPVDALIEWSRR